jgi:P-type Ca2+ transporter type 2C
MRGSDRGAAPHMGHVMSSLGLTSAEAEARLAKLGPNTIATRPRVRLISRIGHQLRDPLLILLICGVVLTLLLGDLVDAAVITAVIVVNTTVGVVQEIRADKAITALSDLSAPQARVIRGGTELQIPAAAVVPGDLLVLAEGDLVAADGEVIESAALLVDESSLTGESLPVDKSPAAADPAARVVSAGTVVVRGRARILASATGRDSATGRLAALLTVETPDTPLQRRLRGLSRVIAAVAVGLCLVVAVQGLLRGQPWELVMVAAISLMVAAVPESLPTVIVLSLALGADRMAAHRAIVRRLPAVETLGSVSVIATDKTGTLTEGRMVAQRLWTPTGTAQVSGGGYAPDGAVCRDGHPVFAADAADLATLLRAAMLCCDAALVPPGDDRPDWHVMGDPTEAALLVAGAKLGLRLPDLSAAAPRVTEFPFDSFRKRMTTVHASGDAFEVICKGAPELLLHDNLTAEDPVSLERAAAAAHKLAVDGLRVLAVAARVAQTQPTIAQDAETDLRLLGLIGIADPAKTTARETLAAIRDAGIEPMLITGDHSATARCIAQQVGLADETAEVVDARGASDEALSRVTVVARATPEQKVAIVAARQDAGQAVAMIGDGVNDGPALRRADIGVAMGQRGTEVARQAADLVLADDELATLVTAIAEGRRIYANVRRFLLFGMSGGAAEILVMLIGPFLGMPLPLLPAQILWINLLTHGLTGVSLGAEPAEAHIMTQPPRPPAQSVLGDSLWKRILRIAVLLAGVSLAAGIWAQYRGAEWQTMIFVTLGFSQLGVALALRARPRTWSNPFLIAAVAAAALLQLAGVYVPFLAAVLGTEPLPATDLAVAAGLSVAGYIGIHLDRRVHPG